MDGVTGKALTWDELANIYDKGGNGRKAKTLPMATIFDWAERQTERFCVSEDGSLYLKNKP